MEPPEEFADGFTWKTVVGAVFLALLIMPGSMYLALVVGPEANMQSAARWVTIILFAEISRRSFRELKMQEIYVFYFMAGIAMMAICPSIRPIDKAKVMRTGDPAVILLACGHAALP